CLPMLAHSRTDRPHAKHPKHGRCVGRLERMLSAPLLEEVRPGVLDASIDLRGFRPEADHQIRDAARARNLPPLKNLGPGVSGFAVLRYWSPARRATIPRPPPRPPVTPESDGTGGR